MKAFAATLPILLFSMAVAVPACGESAAVLPFGNVAPGGSANTGNLDWIGESIAETLRDALTVRGVITPDHTIRTKNWPLVLPTPELGKLGDFAHIAREAAESFAERYRRYFERNNARTGGIKGAIGLAEDPGEAAIACRQVAPVDEAKLANLKSPHEVFSERASLIFKSTQVTRFWDAKRRALVYLVYTDRIIEGSPRNSISVVPLAVK